MGMGATSHGGATDAGGAATGGCAFSGARKAAFGFVYDGGDGPSNRELFSVSNCRFDGNEFWLLRP